MESMDSTPNSSVKSSTTASTLATSSESEPRDSNYFPGCRKDANCNCEICIASINATLDLMPQSFHRSSLTKLSSSKPILPRSPISFNQLTPLTPKSVTQSVKVSKPTDRNMAYRSKEKVKKRNKELGNGVTFFRVFLGLSLVLAAEFGFSWMVSVGFHPNFSVDMVRDLGEKSLFFEGLKGKVSFLKEEVWRLTSNDSLNRTYLDFKWQINQDGLLLSSRSVLFRSMTEEVTIWGWPLQTAGLLTAEFSSRSFTVLSGRLTEWQNGEDGYVIRKANESWVQEKWSAFPVQLDPNTWILEYKQGALRENARLISAVIELLHFRLAREVMKMQQEFWLQFAFGSQCSQFTTSPKIPT